MNNWLPSLWCQANAKMSLPLLPVKRFFGRRLLNPFTFNGIYNQILNN